MKYCTNCGNELRENANFCEKCGTKRIEKNKEQNITNVNISASPKKSNTKTIIIITVAAIIVVFLVSCISIFGFLWYEVRETMNHYDDFKYEFDDYYDEDEEKLSVDEFSLRYSTDWTNIGSYDDNIASIIRDQSSITISKYLNVESMKENDIENEMIKDYKSRDFKLESKRTIYVYENWNQLIFKSSDEVNIIMYQIKNNTIYYFIYMAPLYDYYTEEDDIREIYYSIQVSNYIPKTQ